MESEVSEKANALRKHLDPVDKPAVDPVMKPLGTMLHRLENDFRMVTDQLKARCRVPPTTHHSAEDIQTMLISLYTQFPPSQETPFTSLQQVYKDLCLLSPGEAHRDQLKITENQDKPTYSVIVTLCETAKLSLLTRIQKEANSPNLTISHNILPKL